MPGAQTALGHALGTTMSAPVDVRGDASPLACAGYVAARADASAYHRPDWLGVIGRAFGHDTTYLTAVSGDAIVGVLPLVFFDSRLFGRFAVSIPFVNYGGIVADSTEAGQRLLERAIDEARARGASHLELRHSARLFEGLSAKRHKVAMRLRLEPTADEQWRKLDRKLRNQVRKAEKSLLTVQIGGADLLDQFYAVFARNMRDLGTPVYGRRFFEEVLRTFADCSRVFVVHLAGEPVAASVVHWHRREVEVPWASAIREYNPLCANVLLYWHMLRFSIEQGLEVFDFGRSTPGEGTYQFKKQWGAQPLELVWEYWTRDAVSMPDISPANPKFAMAIQAWQRLPVRLTTALGPSIVRNIP